MKNKLKIALVAVVAIVIGIAIFLGYMGVLSSPDVTQKTMGPYIMVYDSFVGPYKDTKPVFDKVSKQMEKIGINPELAIGVYYDDPSKVSADKLRSDCGFVLPKKEINKLQELKKYLKVRTIQKSPGLVVDFPIRNSFSFMVGPMKAYPVIGKFAKTNDINLELMFELYDLPNKTIHYVGTIKK